MALALIGFQADDGLWHRKARYRPAQDRFADPYHLLDRQPVAERRNPDPCGHGMRGFALSMRETAVKVTDGQPTMTRRVLHTASGGSMMAGCREATPGSHHATYAPCEVVHLSEGRILIIPGCGDPATVKADDAPCVERDFREPGRSS